VAGAAGAALYLGVGARLGAPLGVVKAAGLQTLRQSRLHFG
jgi:hypothetical protein